VFAAALALCLAIAAPGAAQEKSPAGEQSDTPTTVFNHPNDTRWWISGQFNTIYQAHPDFPARYSGPNSLRANGEAKDSRVLTLYTGLALTKYTEIFFDAESSGGRGVGDALGLAGFTNLDVVRNPELGPAPYVARVMLRQIIALSRATVEGTRNQFALATRLPARRLELRAGKFSTVDFFDVNAVGSDSHLQFMNWTIDNNGAYDYAADTRGYSYGVMLEYDDRAWSARFAEMLMPKEANGIDLEWNLRRARAENFELELRPSIKGRATVIRLLGYANHANMGDYREAIALFLAGVTARPDVIATRRQGRVKYGFGFNLEQPLTKSIRGFVRVGWNEGRHESFAYTEVNQTVALGADVAGEHWRRKLDKVGVALVTNGISRDQQRYLALGGLGFLLGDGGLTYGRETIFEAYYTAHLWRGLFASFDLQHINNPGYNRDRGPVWLPAGRLHVDF
jgi:high affinity Mn2+ porin